MPAVSAKQRRLMALAEHHPEKVLKKNRAVLSMTKSQLSDFSSTRNLSGPERLALAREAVGQDLAATQKYQRRGWRSKV